VGRVHPTTVGLMRKGAKKLVVRSQLKLSKSLVELRSTFFKAAGGLVLLLHIALQDGFFNDEVIIRVNGAEVFHQSQVKTRFQIGLAASVETNVPEGVVNVAAILPQKNLDRSTVLEIATPTYLAISIDPDGNISFHVSTEQFRYL
jgi:hypothetical protein